MSAQVEDLSSTHKRLKIQIPENVISGELDAAYGQVSQNAKVPGFRPGRVPRNVLEKRFGSDVRAQVLDKLVPDYYGRALREAGLHPVMPPRFESEVRLTEGQPLELALTVEVRPKVEPLDYEKIELVEIPLDAHEDEVDKALASIRKERATLEPADVAEPDSHVVMDYDAYEGETLLEEVSDKDFQFDLDQEGLPAEFKKETVGKKAGDTYEFSVTYPEDHPGEKVAGKTMTFKVSLKEVKRRALPDLDDGLAKELGFDDLENLRKRVTENIRNMKDARAREFHRLKVSDILLENHEVDLPNGLLEREIEVRVEEARGQQSEESEPPSDAELRDRVRPEAEKSLKGRILIELIGEKEGVKVEEEDLRMKLAEIATTSGIAADALVQYYSQNQEALENLRSGVYESKVLQQVVSKARFVKKESA